MTHIAHSRKPFSHCDHGASDAPIPGSDFGRRMAVMAKLMAAACVEHGPCNDDVLFLVATRGPATVADVALVLRLAGDVLLAHVAREAAAANGDTP